MKKIWRSMASAAVSVLLIGLTACGGDGTSSTASSANDSEREAKVRAESGTVSLLIPGYDGTDESSYYTRAIKAFEEKFGKKVTIVQAVGEQLWNEKVAAQIAAKDPIDLFVISVDQYLGMYQKDYLMPVDDYVDLTRKGHNLKVMDDFIKFDGKYYAAGMSASPYVLYYNRDILLSNGYDADEPRKRYEEGAWDWEAFVEIARTCTDEESSITGLENMFDEVFMASNACSAVTFADGKYTLNIKTAAMRNTLEMVQDVFNKNPVCGGGYVTGQNKFLKGKAAMHGAYSYEEATFTELKNSGSINIDFGVAPFPTGPDNTEKRNFGHSTGFAISTGADCPYGAGMLMDMILDEADKDNASKGSQVLPENQKMYDELSENLYIPSYTDGIIERGFGAFYLLYDIRNGEDINQKLAQYETTYQKFVDDANKLLEK